MATTLAACGQAFDFHYSGRSAGLMAYRDHLQKKFGAHLHLHCDDDPACALDLDALLAAVDHATHLYVCGPKGLIDACRTKAEAAGIAKERIHFELFDTPQEQTGDTSFEVEINSGEVFTVAPGQSIIEALEEGGVDVMYDCQRGDCGICQTEVISGTPDHRDVVLSDAERASGKVMQICVSRAKTPRLVLDI
jgi:vanillate O-demethylase ferredoxin subunit